MRKCKHEYVVEKYDIDGLDDPLELMWRECLDCGAWLSLGESNDEPEAVQREMRAAAMLACHEQDDECTCFDVSKLLQPMRLEREARELVCEVMWTLRTEQLDDLMEQISAAIATHDAEKADRKGAGE